MYPFPLLPYYWSHLALTSAFFVRQVSPQVTGCVNITWLIGCDKSCTLSYFFLVYSSPSVQQKALPASRSLGWLWIGLFVCPCRSESSRPTLCPCALSRWEWGLRLPAGSLFALAGNQSVSGGGMHGVEWEVMRLDASWGTPWLCAPSTLVFPKGRDQVYLTTSALSSTQRAPPDPDKICMCHNLQHDPTPCKPCHTPLAQFLCFGAHGWTPWKQIWCAVMNVTISTGSLKKSIKLLFTAHWLRRSCFMTVARFCCEWQVRFCCRREG